MKPGTALTLQLLASVVFTVVYVNAELGAVALHQLDPCPFPEWARVDTASDIKLSQMILSLRKSRRKLRPGSAPLAMPLNTAEVLS